MDVHKGIAIISANLGGFDKPEEVVKQGLQNDYFLFTDENFPLRNKAMTPRLQAKIPKFFGWQLKPGYDYYLWMDGNLKLTRPDSLEFFFNHCQGHDIVVLKHHRRPNIRQEARYLRKGLREQSNYLVGRYAGEWGPEQIEEIGKDKTFVDDLLAIGGIFMYKNTPAVQAMLKEWWYFTSRYTVFDQLAFAYVLKTSGLKINALPIDYTQCDYVKQRGHKHHGK